jgi:hypothetical protein
MAKTPGSRRRISGTSGSRTTGPGLRVARSRGAFSGLLLILLGIWGGLVPMVGPYLHYAYTPDKAWTVTSGRAWLEFAPAAAAIIGGIVLLASRLRPWALIGATLALLGGAWFTIGSVVVRLWMRTPPAQGTPVGGAVARAVEQIGFFTGLGAVIICLAAIAIGRLSLVSARDTKMAGRAAADSPEAILTDPRPTDVTTPLSTSGAQATAPKASNPTARKTPMAALTRIASRNKPAGQSGDSADAETARSEQLSSSSGRR